MRAGANLYAISVLKIKLDAENFFVVVNREIGHGILNFEVMFSNAGV